MFLPTLHELLKAKWQHLRARRALPCMIAIVMSLAAGLLAGHPGTGVVTAGGALTALFAWLAYTLVNVNYGLFAVFLTGYIVFLLNFGGLSTRVIVAHRTLNTALDRGLALLSYVTVLLRRIWHPAEAAPPPARSPSLDLAVPQRTNATSRA